VRKLGNGFVSFAQGYQNINYDHRTNGEKFVLESLARVYPEALIFDVGAHHGDWSTMASEAVPRGSIHAFEVIPATFAKLRQACARLPRVTLHPFGLSDHDGQMEFAVATGRDELSSGVAGVHGDLHKFAFETVACPVFAGHSFCRRESITQIDFLKLDVEGLEPKILQGFLPMLDRRQIRMIQFEYGQVNLQARFFLGDFYAMLATRGMKLGKIYPNYVDFRDYSFIDDRLEGPNYLAVDSREERLISLLQG
jgi:FkbM family methyltransferase